MFIRIKLIGANCSNGMKLSKMITRAIEEVEEKPIFEKVNNDKMKDKYGITNVPALIIDEKIVSEGKVLSVREIKKLLST